MKILIDECVDQRLRHLLSRHDCQTSAYAGLAGLKNGVLLTAAEAAGFCGLISASHRPRSANSTESAT
jgi:hypothetical protein